MLIHFIGNRHLSVSKRLEHFFVGHTHVCVDVIKEQSKAIDTKLLHLELVIEITKCTQKISGITKYTHKYQELQNAHKKYQELQNAHTQKSGITKYTHKISGNGYL